MRNRIGSQIVAIRHTRRRPRYWLSREWCTWVVWWGNSRFVLTGCVSSGIHVDAREWWQHGAPPKLLKRREWKRPIMKKRQAAKAATDATHLAALESSLFSDLLPLVEHCAVTKYDDGDARKPGWITLKTQGAAWIVQVKDPDTCCSFQAVGDSLDKALSTAALLLSCDEAPWEPDTFLAQQAARSKRK